MNRKNSRREFLAGSLGLIALGGSPFLWGCGTDKALSNKDHPARKVMHFGIKAFGTGVRVLLREDTPKALVRKAQMQTTLFIAKTHNRFTLFEESPLRQLNAIGADRSTTVADEIAEVTRISLQFASESKGGFDPTIGGLMRLIRQSPNPDKELLLRAQQGVGYQNVKLDKNAITFVKDGTSLDFNAVVKGWAVDRLGEILQRQGIQHYLINAGGDIVARGTQGDIAGWEVHLEHPEQGKPLQRFLLKDEAVATSGNYHQLPRKDGSKLIHLLHPQLAQPINELSSATVLASTAAEADAWATAAYVSGMKWSKGFSSSKRKFLFVNKNLEVQDWVL